MEDFTREIGEIEDFMGCYKGNSGFQCFFFAGFYGEIKDVTGEIEDFTREIEDFTGEIKDCSLIARKKKRKDMDG